jgi:hypothetical protein
MVRENDAYKLFANPHLCMQNIARSDHDQHKTTLPKLTKVTSKSVLERERERESLKVITSQMRQTSAKK